MKLFAVAFATLLAVSGVHGAVTQTVTETIIKTYTKPTTFTYTKPAKTVTDTATRIKTSVESVTITHAVTQSTTITSTRPVTVIDTLTTTSTQPVTVIDTTTITSTQPVTLIDTSTITSISTQTKGAPAATKTVSTTFTYTLPNPSTTTIHITDTHSSTVTSVSTLTKTAPTITLTNTIYTTSTQLSTVTATFTLTQTATSYVTTTQVTTVSSISTLTKTGPTITKIVSSTFTYTLPRQTVTDISDVPTTIVQTRTDYSTSIERITVTSTSTVTTVEDFYFTSTATDDVTIVSTILPPTAYVTVTSISTTVIASGCSASSSTLTTAYNTTINPTPTPSSYPGCMGRNSSLIETSNGDVFSRYCGVVFSGADIDAPFYASGLNDCIVQCSSLPGCTAVTFNSQHYSCYPKNSTGVVENDGPDNNSAFLVFAPDSGPSSAVPSATPSAPSPPGYSSPPAYSNPLGSSSPPIYATPSGPPGSSSPPIYATPSGPPGYSNPQSTSSVPSPTTSQSLWGTPVPSALISETFESGSWDPAWSIWGGGFSDTCYGISSPGLNSQYAGTLSPGYSNCDLQHSASLIQGIEYQVTVDIQVDTTQCEFIVSYGSGYVINIGDQLPAGIPTNQWIGLNGTFIADGQDTEIQIQSVCFGNSRNPLFLIDNFGLTAVSSTVYNADSPATGGNIVAQPNFDDGSTDAYTVQGGGATYSIASNGYNGAPHSLLAQASGNSETYFSFWQGVPVTAGTVYNFSLAVSISSFPGECQILLSFKDPSRYYGAYYYALPFTNETAGFPQPGEWGVIGAAISAPQDNSLATVIADCFYQGSDVNFQFGDISVVPLS